VKAYNGSESKGLVERAKQIVALLCGSILIHIGFLNQILKVLW